MKKNKIVIASFMLLSLGACKKVMDIPETDFLSSESALKTVVFNEQAILGAYNSMSVEMNVLLNGVLTDELRVADFYNSATVHEWQYGTTDVTIRDNYTAIIPQYRTIDRLNRVLEALPGATSNGASDEALRSRLRGEALYMRAFSHFELFRYYSNSAVATDPAMPYMTTVSVDNQPQARLTVGAFMTKLKADLAEAKTLLPNNLTDINRATRLAASGLQARIALYLKEWTDAITYSSEYITGVPLATRANFPGIWTDANTNEQAFRLVRTTSNTRMGSLYRGVSSVVSGVTQIGVITWAPSNELYNSYDQVNDVRFASYLKEEPLVATSSRSNKKIIAKYAGSAYATANENVNNQKVFRTGEMYLIRAEARAETNDLTGAATDLNALRTARINGYVNVALATKDAAITEIMNERFKELAFEGHRFWDLKRRNMPVTRLTIDAPNTAAENLSAGNFRFLMPIPNWEILANPLMTQNTGYSN